MERQNSCIVKNREKEKNPDKNTENIFDNIIEENFLSLNNKMSIKEQEA